MTLGMICTCNPNGVREVEERRLRIFRRMGIKDMEQLTTAIVLSLAFDFSVDAADIAVDQWFGVAVRSALTARSALTGTEPAWVSAECDWPGDGFAAIWEHLAERYPECVTTRDNSRSVRFAERVSASLLQQYVAAHDAYETHRKEAHNGPNDCPPCDDCSVLGHLVAVANHVLDQEWGSRDLDPAVEAVFT